MEVLGWFVAVVAVAVAVAVAVLGHSPRRVLLLADWRSFC